MLNDCHEQNNAHTTYTNNIKSNMNLNLQQTQTHKIKNNHKQITK